jgi:type II secretory pathway component PulF
MNLEKLELEFAKIQFGAKKRSMMYQKVASFSKQGVPIFDTIRLFEKAYSQKKGDARGLILRAWLTSMGQGFTFSESLKGFAPDAEIMLISAGESSNDIEGGMKKAVFITESVRRIHSTLLSGLSYSVTLILTLMGMIVMFSLKIIPQVVEAMPIPVDQWPPLSQKLYWLSLFVKEYGIGCLVGCIVFLIVSIQTLGIFRGKIRRYCDYLPPWSVYKTLQGSVFLITLSSMMAAGIPMNTGMLRIKELVSEYVGDYIEKMMELMKMGAQNGEALDVGLLDYDTALDVKLLGKTADFQSALMMLGQQSVEDAVNRISVITKGVSTGVLFLIAGFVIFVYSGFFALTQALSDIASAIH